MKKYEMEFCVHIVKQIYELFSRLCKDSSDIPQYRIICNFESNEGINSYEFENFQYKGCTIGIRVISYNKIDTESRFDKIEEVSLEDIEYKYEFIEYNASNCCALTIIFDTLHIPYETHFFNYVLSAYFITKKIVIKKWLDNLENRKKSKSIFDFYNRSIFRKLSCGYETEFIISRAVMDYF